MISASARKKFFIILVISFVVTCIISNFTERKVRLWIEKGYAMVTGKPMVYDISQTDEKGVPYLIEGTIGKQRNPMTICNKALSYYDNFKNGDTTQRQLFLNCADWLSQNLAQRDSFAVLKYDYNWAYYNMIAPWRSGLANGMSLKVFIKAHAETNEKKYLSVAKQILNSFYVEVDSGGVTYKSATSGWWFEEFADEEGLESRVLNGHMFALVAIYEYGQYTKDPGAQRLFAQGLTALKNNLAKYDNENGHSFYDQRGTPANLKYQKIHVDLLDQLFTITGDEVYRTYRDKWAKYDPWLITRLITPPVKPIDVAIWLVNFAIITFVIGAISLLINQKNRLRYQ